MLSDMPIDLLKDIFARLPSEHTLLGAIAKVNREFREIALEQEVRSVVRENFVQNHIAVCDLCKYLENKDTLRDPTSTGARNDNASANVGLNFAEMNLTRLFPAKEVVLSCVMCANISTHGSVSIDKTSITGSTILHEAAANGLVDVLRYFLEEMDALRLLEKRDLFGNTVLHIATVHNQLPVIRYFVEERGDTSLINMQNINGDTLLHQASRCQIYDVFRYFLVIGDPALINSKNKSGQTVSQIISEHHVGSL